MATRPVLIVGDGGHAHDIAAILEASGRVAFCYDESPIERRYAGTFPPTTYEYLIGVNNPSQRRSVARRYIFQAMALARDPSARVGPDCSIGVGCVLAPNVVLLRDVKLGDHVHVNYGASATRAAIGAFVTIAPGVTICGDVRIGAGTFIGAGAVISNLVTIGPGAVVGAGAVVVDDVPPGAVAVGVPACNRDPK
jgi:sugar O-acyltransferase (sialic acid O-acetyltransferase NeuD family)